MSNFGPWVSEHPVYRPIIAQKLNAHVQKNQANKKCLKIDFFIDSHICYHKWVRRRPKYYSRLIMNERKLSYFAAFLYYFYICLGFKHKRLTLPLHVKFWSNVANKFYVLYYHKGDRSCPRRFLPHDFSPLDLFRANLFLAKSFPAWFFTARLFPLLILHCRSFTGIF